jgi:hypothetical protein
MSWCVEAHGKPVPLAAKIKGDIDAVRCMEPEETIKSKARDIISTALAAYPDAMAVHVKASGSQNPLSDGIAVNTLLIEIQPLYNFIE